MGKNLSEKIKNRKLKCPGSPCHSLLSAILAGRVNLLFKPQYVYHFDEAEMKGKQVVVIADHAAWDSFYYVMAGYPFAKLNTVVGYHHVCKRFMYTILVKVFQVIPKRNYQNDMLSMKQMLKVAKMGGSLLVFPEGTQSKTGSTMPITPSTAGFLKKLGIPVVLCKSFGSYLARPLWKTKTSKGHQEFHYELLFDESQLSVMDKDEIYEKMLDRFRYNDFEWNKNFHYIYGQDAEGMEKIVYTCPNCGEKFRLKTTAHEIYCEACGMHLKVNEFLEFDAADGEEPDAPKYHNIDEWLKDERKLLKEEIKDPSFKIEFDCEVFRLKEKLSLKPFESLGDARAVIDAQGISLASATASEKSFEEEGKGVSPLKADLRFDIKDLPSILTTVGEFNLIYHNNELYKIVPKGNNNICMRNMIAIEELHAQGDAAWEKVMADVYSCENNPKQI